MSTDILNEILEFDDAGAGDDHPAKGVTMAHIRAWFDEVSRLEGKIADLQDEVELWKDRCGAERQAHEATIKHCDYMLDHQDS